MRPNGDVGNELALNRLPEKAIELLCVLLRRRSVAVPGLVEVEVPPRLRPDGRPLARDGHPMSGAKQLHALEQRAVGEDVLEREVLEKMRATDLGSQRVVGQQRLDLGPEEQER